MIGINAATPRGALGPGGASTRVVSEERAVSVAEAAAEEERAYSHCAEGAHDAVMDAFHAYVVPHLFFYFLKGDELALFGGLYDSHGGVEVLVVGIVFTLSPTTPWPLWFITWPKSAGGSLSASPARGTRAWCRRRRHTRHCPRRDRRRRDGARCRAGV